MARKKGGLGSVQPAEDKEDLLDSVFGGKAEKQEIDTPPPAKDGERVAKYFKLDREVVRKLRVYAAVHELKEVQVIEDALRALFQQEAD